MPTSHNWRVGLTFIAVVAIAAVAVSGYAHRIASDTTKPVAAVVASRHLDLVQGCKRSSARIYASILDAGASAIADGVVASDPSQTPRTRAVRRASSQAHWEAAARYAATLVDCRRAFPAKGRGRKVLDVATLLAVRRDLEDRFGRISPEVVAKVGRLIRRYR